MKKVFSLRRIAAATAMLLPMLGITAMAALPQAGKAYRFTNVAYSNVLTSNGPGSNATCNKPDTESTAQEWVVSQGPSNNTYYLRSLITGLYLCSPDRTSNPWYLSSSTTDAALSIVESDGHLTIRKAGSSNSFGYLHNDAAGQAVCWDATQNTSWWTSTALSYTEAEIEAAIKRAEENAAVVNNESKYQTALNAIFDDKACTVLKSKYSSMTDSQLAADANYKALAPELQEMVKKVKSGDWTETDIKTKQKWDSTHAKKFRVQNYEPYSRAVEVQPLTGIQYYTNMNNPTGITTKAYNTLYVMVDKAPADGSTIYINGALGSAMFNDWNRGTQLHEGLNIIPVWNDDALQYIYYTADTYSNGKRAHKLSEFPDVKIHIEGGSLNGFYDYLGDDLYTPDTNEDWFYYRDRASHTMFDLVGKYVILHFFFDKVYNNGPNTGSLVEGLKGILTSTDSRVDLPKIMEAWDDMCFSEHLIMGLRSNEDIRSARAKGYYAPLEAGDKAPNDLHEYFNNRMMGITMQGDLYMNATNWRTAYAPYTVSDILLNFRTSSGCIWGPAHEYGHMNQTPMKLVGTTEISNNVFSNVAVFYQGIDCSRADYASTQREIFNKGGIFLDHGLWGATRMFFQLWLYYHQVGHNRKFYPTLYQLLRENPLQHPYEYNERYDKLHFAKMCCIAAGEDLTDFFESWGFFIPVNHMTIEDYSTNIATLTVEDIEAVKAEIAALKLPKNYAILNIDDRPGSTRGDYGGEWHKSLAGALGGLKDFAENVKAESGLLYTISGRDITVSGGKGGVGFVGYSADGELITFSNDYSWTLNDKAAEALATNKGKLYAVSGDNTLVAVKLAATDGSSAQKTSAANAMITAAKAMIDRIDPNEAIVGSFRASHLTNLQKLVEEAEKLVKSDPAKAYNLLTPEYYRLLNDEHARVSIIPDNTYIIKNRKTGYVLFATRSAITTYPVNKYPTAQLWVLQDAGDGKYYLYAPQVSRYMGEVRKSQAPSVEANIGHRFEITEVTDGYYGLSAEGIDGGALHIDGSGKVVGWYTSETGSQWQIIHAGDAKRNAAIANLQELVEKTSELLPNAGTTTTSGTQAINLAKESFSSNANVTTDFSELLDKNIGTSFVTDKDASASSDAKDHWLQFELEEPIDILRFRYENSRLDPVLAPKTMNVLGSTDGKVWIPVAYINEGTPNAPGAAFASPVIRTAEPYSYFRIIVTTTHTGKIGNDGHQYFAMASFAPYTFADFKATPSASYPKLTAEVLNNASKYNSLAIAAIHFKDSSAEELEAVYDELLPWYQAMANAMDQSGIATIEADEETTDNTIYDLSGRRLQSATTPGLYIIGGKKVLVK